MSGMPSHIPHSDSLIHSFTMVAATKRKHNASDTIDHNGTTKRQKGQVSFPGHPPSKEDLEVRRKCASGFFDAQTFESYRQQYADSKP